jgi:hypothetical protein
MVKYFKLDKTGKLPEFTFKNSEYWVDHDIRHIKDSFKWCINKSIFMLAAIGVLTIIGALNNGWNLLSIFKFVFYTYISFFLTTWFIRVLFYKGYNISVGAGQGWSTRIDENIPTVKSDFDEHKLDKLEREVKNIEKLIKTK